MPENQIFNRNTIIKITLGTTLGVLAIFLAFRGVSSDQLWAVLRTIKTWPVIMGVLLVLVNVAIISLRWWVLLLRKRDFSEYRTLLGGVYLGQMVNIVVPLRLGELARIYFVSERTQTTKSGLLGSLVLEKVLDLVSFGLALLFLITVISLPPWVAEPGNTLLVLGLASLVSVLLLVIFGRRFLTWITPLLGRLPGSWGERISGILERALTGFDSMRSWRNQFPIWSLTLSSLFLSTLTNYVIFGAVGIQLPATAALFTLVVLQVGSAPPSAPGKLGVFHYLVVLALSAYNVDKDLALAYSLVLYVVALMPKIIIGAGVMLFSKWRLPTTQIRREGIIPED